MSEMDWNVFHVDTKVYLAPMFPGASVLDAVQSDTNTSSHHVSQKPGATRLKLRAQVPAKQYVELDRGGQKFSADDLEIARTFCKELEHIYQLSSNDEVHKILVQTLPKRVVVTHTANRAGLSEGAKSTMQSTLDLLAEWSTQTYEGVPICTAIAVESTAADGPTLAEYANVPSSCVLGDGVGTFWVAGEGSRLVRFETSQSVDVNPDKGQYPVVFGAVADYTSDDGRAAAVLNRRGEIFVFARGELLFARRRSRWLYANHEGALAKAKGVHKQELRRAVYRTCLDISVARTGGGLAVARGRYVGQIKEGKGCVSRQDVVGSDSPKGRFLAQVIGGQKFQDLPREVRQELAGMDGAVVLGCDGEVLAAGAIVTIPGGSEGGGRLAAARALAQYGFSVKVSSDGRIQAFNAVTAQGAGQPVALAFEAL